MDTNYPSNRVAPTCDNCGNHGCPRCAAYHAEPCAAHGIPGCLPCEIGSACTCKGLCIAHWGKGKKTNA